MADKRRKDWKDDELAAAAEAGTSGQGAVVESTTRLRNSVDRFSNVSTWMAGAMIFLAVVQIVIVVSGA